MSLIQKKNKAKGVLKILPGAIASLKKNLLEPVFGDSTNDNGEEKPPLRSELFTEEQLDKYAISLAERHTLFSKSTAVSLMLNDAPAMLSAMFAPDVFCTRNAFIATGFTVSDELAGPFVVPSETEIVVDSAFFNVVFNAVVETPLVKLTEVT